MRYVILGNSAAAVAAVDAIRERDLEGSIVMVSPEEGRAYGTPLVSYVLEGKTDPDTAEIRSQEWYDDNAIECRFGQGCAAVAIDVAASEVELADGTRLPFDKLLVATGSVPFMSKVEGLREDAPNSFTFTTMAQALAVQEYLDDLRDERGEDDSPISVVVSGSGLIGAKAAEGLSFHADVVYLVGHAARPLRKLLDDEAAPYLVDVLEDHGIVNVPSTVVESVDCDDDGRIVAAHLSDGCTLPCDALVTAVGVRPNSGMLEEAGARVERGVVVDEHMLTSLDGIYAAGDVVSTYNTLLVENAPIALWPTAYEQGRVAGAAMAGDVEASFEGSFARNAVGFFGEINILGCGIINPGSDTPDIESIVTAEDGAYSKFNVRDGRLVGYLLINRPDAAGIYTYIVSEGIPLDTLPPDIFERTPEMRDLPRALRDERMLVGRSVRPADGSTARGEA